MKRRVTTFILAHAAAAIAMLMALHFVPAQAAEVTRKVWPAPDESQLDLDTADVPFARFLAYMQAVGQRVKARNPTEFENLRFVGLSECTRSGIQLRLVASRMETAEEITARRIRLVTESLEAARAKGGGISNDDLDKLLKAFQAAAY